jgi:type IV pilus assembly protein PilA
MKSLLLAQTLSNIIKQKPKSEQGFTLIELLVTIIIIGVLAALSLPNLLSQIGKARDTELRSTVGTVNRAQQAFHFEHRVFVSSLTDLGVTITQQYQTSPDIDAPDPAVYATIQTNASSTYLKNGTKAYAGRVEFSDVSTDYSVILCGSNSPSGSINAPSDTSACPTGSGEVR